MSTGKYLVQHTTVLLLTSSQYSLLGTSYVCKHVRRKTNPDPVNGQRVKKKPVTGTGVFKTGLQP
jgi:hypothetical protein